MVYFKSKEKNQKKIKISKIDDLTIAALLNGLDRMNGRLWNALVPATHRGCHLQRVRPVYTEGLRARSDQRDVISQRRGKSDGLIEAVKETEDLQPRMYLAMCYLTMAWLLGQC